MILTLIIWLFVGCAAWGYGRIFLSVRSRDESGTSNLPPESLGARLYLGLLCLVCLLAAAAMFIPVRWWVGLMAAGVGVFLSVSGYDRRVGYRDNSVRAGALLLAFITSLALFVSNCVDIFFVTALFQQQSIQCLLVVVYVSCIDVYI